MGLGRSGRGARRARPLRHGGPRGARKAWARPALGARGARQRSERAASEWAGRRVAAARGRRRPPRLRPAKSLLPPRRLLTTHRGGSSVDRGHRHASRNTRTPAGKGSVRRRSAPRRTHPGARPPPAPSPLNSVRGQSESRKGGCAGARRLARRPRGAGRWMRRAAARRPARRLGARQPRAQAMICTPRRGRDGRRPLSRPSGAGQRAPRPHGRPRASSVLVPHARRGPAHGHSGAQRQRRHARVGRVSAGSAVARRDAHRRRRPPARARRPHVPVQGRDAPPALRAVRGREREREGDGGLSSRA